MDWERSIYRFKKFGRTYLVSTDFGTWMFLAAEEFDHFVRYPIDTLDEELIRRLRERYFIVNPSDLDGEIEAFDRKYHAYFEGPTLFIIGITKTCNLKCEYCHANAERKPVGPYQFSPATIAKTVDFIVDCAGDPCTIEFQGGEPLLGFSIIRQFVETARERGRNLGKRIGFSLSTNLTLLNRRMLEFLNENDVGIAGSIDGPRNVHDKQRTDWNGRGTYERARRSFDQASQSGARVCLISVATKHSLSRIEAIVDEFVERGVSELCLNYPQQNGRALDPFFWDRVGLTSEECFELWKGAIEYMARRKATNGVRLKERYLSLILQKISAPTSPNFMDWRSPCGATIGQISFDGNGDIYPCDDARGDRNLRIGNVHKDTYSDVIRRRLPQEIMGASLLENEICDYCVYKPFCGLCPVLSFKSGGTFQLFRSFKFRCVLFTRMFDYVFRKILEGNDAEFSFDKA